MKHNMNYIISERDDRPVRTRLFHRAAFLLCLLFCVSLAGCSADLGTMLTLRKTAKAIQEIRDLSFSLYADGRVSVFGEESALKLSADAALVRSPLRFAMEAEVSAGDLGQIRVPVAVREEETGKPGIYVGAENALQETWFHIGTLELPKTELSLGTLGSLLSGSGAAETVRDDSGAGEKHIRITLPGELLNAGDQHAEDFVADLWVAADSGLPLRMQADLTAPLRGMLDEDMPEYIEILQLSAEIRFTAFNSDPVLRLPQEGDRILDISDRIAYDWAVTKPQ